MANIQPSGTSITALPAGAPVKDLSLDEEGRRVAGEEATEERVSRIGSAAAGKNGSADPPQAENQTSEADRGERGPDINIEDTTAGASAYVSDVTSLSSPNPTNGDDDDTTAPAIQVPQLQSPLTEHSSADPEQIPTTTAQPQPQHPHPPLKRFTSVNITKRFLEKTPSISGTPSGGSPLVGHASGGAGMSGSGQGRGASPSCVSARSPSGDRLAPSRLVTAKLTAVPQPSAASTSGWLRANSSTPGTSAASTPPSVSPQPAANDLTASYPHPTSLSGPQPSKRRPGESPTQNGAPSSSSTSSVQQSNSKHVWAKVPPVVPKLGPSRVPGNKEIQNDFPTAAEAAHGRKTKALNAQLVAETAAAQSAAQKQAMNETAAAFRGAHLDANARHWDEMEDEDSDFLAGVIEFGDGTQYKIEHKAESAPSHDVPHPALPPDAPTPTSSKSFEPQRTHSLVTKEERFGEDFDRSWPRARTSPVQSLAPISLPPRAIPPQSNGPRHSPTDGSPLGSTQSPQDSTSPSSRVLFNERSNRLEPWSKTRLGPGQAPAPMTRRDSREDHSPFGFSRQQPPPHSHPSPANVQLLQKGPSSTDSAWKGGPPRGLGHESQRGRWSNGSGPRGASSSRDEQRPWDVQRTESMSSSDVPGPTTREPSRGREGSQSRWDGGAVTRGSDLDHDRDRGRRNSNLSMQPPPVLPPSLARDRSRDARRQAPPHPSRMHPPSRDLPHVPVPHARSPVISPPASVRSLLSPSIEQSPSISHVPGFGTDEEVDKNTLVKDAMQLAIERAKKRKQEGEAEEKRRLEAAERARKKAEALAVTQEEKKKNEALLPTQEDTKVMEKKPLVQENPRLHRLPQKPNGVEGSIEPSDVVELGVKGEPKMESTHAKTVFGRPPVPLHAVTVPSSLPRRPSIPTPSSHATVASQAESWRSKAVPVPSSPPRPSLASSPPPWGSLAPGTKILELELSVKPDENIEIVDFSDLGKLMGHPHSPELVPTGPEPTPTSSSIKGRRPGASDFFDDRPPPRAPLSPVKSDILSWRRPLSKSMAMLPSTAPGQELGTQTMPIFTADESTPTKATGAESKPPSSPTVLTTSPSFKGPSAQGDQSSTPASQSVYVPPAVLALRSPRTLSHFKEAPMSTLTDTMSRIKGALDGMQSQDSPVAAQAKESNETFIEHRTSSTPPPVKARAVEPSTTLWREHWESRSERSTQVTKILAPPPMRLVPQEVFNVTRSDPPRSPKPAWNAFMVHLPKESRAREAVSKKQLHFWNLPHPSVRWDILSWDPPVEGMNKRELSRDEIFHRKHAVKGGKIRVLLPTKRMVHSRLVVSNASQGSSNSTSQTPLVTAAGVKIKLPSPRNVAEPSQMVPSARSRDNGLLSWRKSATPLTPLKKDRQIMTLVNGSPPDQRLNTVSRSPPPEPSTPLPLFSKPKGGITSSPGSAHSATVSLPMNLPKLALKRPSPDVAFFRTSRGEPESEDKKPLPRFTVTSELDSGESAVFNLVGDQAARNPPSESSQQASKGLNGSLAKEPLADVSLPHPVTVKSESKNSDDSAPGTGPVTPPSTHTSSAWGKPPLSFTVKESPARSAPDPEHLKAVWSQASGRPAGTTSNSLKGIADDLPSIPFTVQDMKSEDGETPPPTAPAPAPSRLSLQEVTRAFQQVPGAPTPVANATRPPSYAQTPLLGSGSTQGHRSNQPVAISLPPQHGVRPAFTPYSHSMVGHSPSPTLMYAPGIPSPGAHHRMTVNGPSPPMAHGMWLPTPPPSSQTGSFMRPVGAPTHTQMMYPLAPGTSPGVPGQMMHRRMSVVSPSGMPPPPGPHVYTGHPMDMQGHMQAQSPHLAHAHPLGHPVPHMHVGHIYSPPQPGQTPAMYAVPAGAGRGGILPRPAYEGMQQVPQLPPHNPGYQTVPPTSFVHPFHS